MVYYEINNIKSDPKRFYERINGEGRKKRIYMTNLNELFRRNIRKCMKNVKVFK